MNGVVAEQLLYFVLPLFCFVFVLFVLFFGLFVTQKVLTVSSSDTHTHKHAAVVVK